MAGSLIKLDEVNVSSSVSSITLGASNWDSSYDVYLLQFAKMTVSADTTMKMRLTSSGTPNSSLNYDRALMQFRTDTTFGNTASTNADHYSMGNISTLALQESLNGNYFLYNFNNASEYSFVTVEDVLINTAGNNRGNSGGFVLTQTEANDGLQILTDTAATIENGIFKLYALKK